METQSFSADIRRYIGLLWHWAWLIALCTILAGGAAFVVSSQSTKVYQATTTVLINEAPTTRTADYASMLASERLAQTYAQMMTQQPVLENVIIAQNLDPEVYTVSTLRNMIQVAPVRDTQLIQVKVENTNAQMAAIIANALVEQFSKRNQELQSGRYQASKQSLEAQLVQLDAQIQTTGNRLETLGSENEAERDRLEANQAQYRQTYAYLLQSYEAVRLAEAQSTSNVVQVEPAFAPTSAIRPQVMQTALLAAVVGMMLAVGVIFLIEALDDTLRNPDDVSRLLGLPILGLIARFEGNGVDGPISLTHPRTPVAEAFRSLRTNIQFASVDKPLHTLLITSPSPSEGKSTIAANLAVVMAQNDRKVVLVDADLRRPRVHKVTRVANRRGVSDLFVQPQVYLDGSLQKTEVPNLMALTSGSLPPNPSELLGSEKMTEILRQVGEQADLVIVDSPPILAVTDSSVLAPRVDGVLLVLKPGSTKMAACRQALEQLKHVGANVLGVVLNDVQIKRSRYYYYNYKGYYYTYNYGESAAEGGKNNGKVTRRGKVKILP